MYAILLTIEFYASMEEVFLKVISRRGDFPEDGVSLFDRVVTVDIFSWISSEFLSFPFCGIYSDLRKVEFR